MTKEAYDLLKIEYAMDNRTQFKILLINDENVFRSKDLTSLDAARLHHVLANIEPMLRGQMTLPSEQLSGTAPLLTITESHVSLYINRLEIHERHDDDLAVDVFYFTFNSFNEIDQIKNYFAEAQY